MDDWSKYKEKIKATHPDTLGQDIEDVEDLTMIIGAVIAKRRELALSQRDLAELCGLPQSSVARIESGQTSPNLTTLLKLLRKLDLSLSVHSRTSADQMRQ